MSLFVTPSATESAVVPERALVLHRISNGRFLMTSHAIVNDDGEPQLAAGHLLSTDDQQQLFDALLNNLQSSLQWLPPQVVCANASSLVWFVKGQVRPMYFRLNVRTQRVNVPWPSLIYKVVQGELFVAAVCSQQRPTPNTPVYHAPVMNVDEVGAVCVGSAACPSGWLVSDMTGWENVMFASNFTHTNHDMTLRLKGKDSVSDKDHVGFYKQLHREQASRFPHRALMPMGVTLEQWITRSE